MRHKNSGRKFDRNTSHRRAMFRNLAANLVLHERIETTDAKAKELRRVAERLITKAMRLGDDLTADVDKLSEAERTAAGASRCTRSACVARFLPRFVARTDGRRRDQEVDLVEKVFLESRRAQERFKGRRRLHAHRQARTAPRRQRADVDHRVRRRFFFFFFFSEASPRGALGGHP